MAARWALAAGAEPPTVRGVDRVATVAPVAIDLRLVDLPAARPRTAAGGDDREKEKDEEARHGLQRRSAQPASFDPLVPRQRQADAQRAGATTAFTTPLLNFAGNSALSSDRVADPVGDVGPNHYVQASNAPGGTQVRVFDKAGTLLAGPLILGTLAPGTSSCSTGYGDPMVLYDRWADRWVLSEMGRYGNRLCFYVSQGGNPATSPWWFYEFMTPYFPDYQKIAAWPEAYYVTTDDSSGGAARIHALERPAMLNGQPAVYVSVQAEFLPGPSFKNVAPAAPDGLVPPPPGTPGLFARQVDSALRGDPADPDRLELFTFAPNFANPPASVLTGPVFLPLTPFDSSVYAGGAVEAITQPDGAPSMWSLWEVLMHRLQYRNFRNYQTLVGSFVVDVDGANRAGVRWFELRNSGSGWTLHQEGTYTPDATHRWMSSAAMDGHGNIALAYAVSSTTTYPGLRYSGRTAAAALGVLDQGEGTIAGGSHSYDDDRWGDYAALAVDPTDECTFWFTGPYMPGALWGTRIASMRFDTCVPFVKGDLSQDLQADLLFRNAVTGAHQVWLMNGTARVGAPLALAPTPALTQWVSGVDDIDGDHRNDLVLWDASSGAVEFWLMNGTTRVGAPVPLSGMAPLPVQWKLSATADFDRDGHPDLVWRDQISQQIAVWTMNGAVAAGMIVPAPDHAVDANWEIVGALDFSGDGYVDFLWYNPDSGKIVSWFMDAGVQRTSGNFTTPPNAGDNNWKVLASADYGIGPNGPDPATRLGGTYDVVWRNATSGRVVVWHMDYDRRRTGGLFTTPDSPSPNPTDWTIVGPR